MLNAGPNSVAHTQSHACTCNRLLDLTDSRTNMVTGRFGPLWTHVYLNGTWDRPASLAG